MLKLSHIWFSTETVTRVGVSQIHMVSNPSQFWSTDSSIKESVNLPLYQVTYLYLSIELPGLWCSNFLFFYTYAFILKGSPPQLPSEGWTVMYLLIMKMKHLEVCSGGGAGGAVRSEVAVAGDQLFTTTFTSYALSTIQFSTPGNEVKMEDANRCEAAQQHFNTFNMQGSCVHKQILITAHLSDLYCM